MKKNFLFLNKFAAINRSEIFDLSSENYINLVKFFETGVMDRTHSLVSGFKYDIIDRIPEVASPRPNIDEIMLQKAQKILDLAEERNKKLLDILIINYDKKCVGKYPGSGLMSLSVIYHPHVHSNK